jgi:uncharacterized cupredoxin-like copper-binding protein
VIRTGFVVVSAVALAAAALAASAPAGSTGSSQTPLRISVGMSEFKFALKPKTATKRVVSFAVKNNGSIGHDFKIAGKKTPVLAAGKSATLRVTFRKAGRYPFLCTLPSHAPAGMKGVLIVK